MMNSLAWDNRSQLEVLIKRAIDPYKAEPDYASHLEVAKYIKDKKANTPFEASKMVVRYVNDRNPHIAFLALALLETLVTEVGYALQLQIATKWFLNELVRRFPERPPQYPGRVMTKILDLIHTWNEGICVSAKHKEDLVNIRDMHRLLTFKGYRFRDTGRTQLDSAIASTSNLKTAEELEQEDREAQSAKLQELIRRGTPRDLAAAQELMKALAGAEPEKKPDYRSQSLNELNKLEQKVILLNEMLDNVDTERGEKFASGDVYDQVATILSSARPKIQKWISDAESNDPEMMDIFLQMNDQINSVLNRYESYKKGDYVAAANPVPIELAGSSRSVDTSLIDFDDAQPANQSSSNPADDLESIFGGSASAAAPTNITSMPPQNSTQSWPQNLSRPAAQNPIPQHQQLFTAPTPSVPGANYNNLAGAFTGPSSSPSPPNNNSPFGSIMLPITPQPNLSTSPPLSKPGNGVQDIWGSSNLLAPASASSSLATPGSSTAMPAQPAQPVQQTSGQSGQKKDPFSDLVGLF